MLFLAPCEAASAKALSEGNQLLRVLLGRGAGKVVFDLVSGLTAGVEVFGIIFPAWKNERERLQDTVVAQLAFGGLVTLREEQKGAQLERCIVSDVESPILRDFARARIIDIAVGQSPEVTNLLRAGFVGPQPAVLQPSL